MNDSLYLLNLYMFFVAWREGGYHFVSFRWEWRRTRGRGERGPGWMCVFGLRSGNKTGGIFLIQVLLKEVKQDLKMWTLRNVVSYLVCALLVKRGGGSKLIVRVGLFAFVWDRNRI